MTDGSTATIDVKDLFSKEDITLENYARFREAALANENSTKALEELADKLDTSNPKSAVKKGIALWLLGRTKPAIEALGKGHEKSDETASAFLGRLLLSIEDSKTANAKLKEAIAEHKDSKVLQHLYILSMLHMGELESAEEALKKATKAGESAETSFLKGFYAELTGDYEEAKKLFAKEIGVALANGVVWGGILGVIAWALYGNVKLGIVMTLAMTLNLLLAAIMGVVIPTTMAKLGRDPALGSSVIITAFTDSGGFFIFLGLATLFLL